MITIVVMIAALCAASVGFTLFFSERRNRREMKGLLGKMNEKDEDVIGCTSNRTPLTAELLKKAVSVNGFVPVQNGDWFDFKIQGEMYAVSCAGHLVQFFRGFRYGVEDDDIDLPLLRQAARMVESETAIGRICFEDDGDRHTISFRISGIEMTCEHLCDAFMGYIRCLDNLVDRHCDQYGKLLEEKNQAAVPDAKKAGCGTKIFS